MGVSGSGKSTLGTALAKTIDCPFLEADDFHAAKSIEKMRAGVPLTDDDRWPWLDRLGQAIRVQVLDHRIVVAACSALRRAYRDRLRQVISAPIALILLDADSDELLRRLTHRAHHYMPPSLLGSQLDTLERPQPDELAITLDARQGVDLSCEQIVTWLLHLRHE